MNTPQPVQNPALQVIPGTPDNFLGVFTELTIEKEAGYYGVTLPVMYVLKATEPQTAANWTTPFFIANRNYQVLYVKARYETANDVSLTLNVLRVPDGTPPASGTAILSTEVDLHSTANTNKSGVITSVIANLRLVTGDALALQKTGTLTTIAGLTVYILLTAA